MSIMALSLLRETVHKAPDEDWTRRRDAVLREANKRIDQTHFVTAGPEHIWVDIVDKPWAQFYFTDETGDAHGPWLTWQEAQFQMSHYVQYVLGD
jgi:hypothetical protein